MSDSEPANDERRRALRQEAFILAEVTPPSGEVRAVAIDDVSEVGVALLVYGEIEIGDHLRVKIHSGGVRIEVEGDVVRRVDVPPHGPWRYRVGVEIDPPSEALREAADRINEQVRALRGETASG